MLEIIIAAIVGVFVGFMIGTTIMALLSFRKLTDYEEGTANCLATSCYVQPHHYHKDNRDLDCPLVEVPTPHGRLIDADAYIDKHEECGWLDDITVDEFNAITPTIIEAEVSEE